MSDEEVDECLRKLREAHTQVALAQATRNSLIERLALARIDYKFNVVGTSWKRSVTAGTTS